LAAQVADPLARTRDAQIPEGGRCRGRSLLDQVSR
jgi:hypothetical protein